MGMEIIIAIICLIAVIFIFMIVNITKSRNKVKSAVYKINGARASINNYMDKIISIINKSKEYIKDEEFTKGVDSFKFGSMDSVEKYQAILKCNAAIVEVIFEDEELSKNKEFNELMEKFRENKSYMEGSIKYYNYCTENYQNVFKSLSVRLVKSFCGYREFENYTEQEMGTL